MHVPEWAGIRDLGEDGGSPFLPKHGITSVQPPPEPPCPPAITSRLSPLWQESGEVSSPCACLLSWAFGSFQGDQTPSSSLLFSLTMGKERSAPGQRRRTRIQGKGGMDFLKHLWLRCNPQSVVKCLSLHLCSSSLRI